MSDDTITRTGGSGRYLERVRDAGARVNLSVLDRLLDDAPELERDRPISAGEALAVLKRALRRDLEALLNGRRRFRSVPRHYGEVQASSLCFGLPDFTSGAMGEAEARERLRIEVEQAIRIFEPRLAQVNVAVLPAKEALSTTLHLRIDALLHAEPAPEPISFDTLVHTATAEIEVSGGTLV